MALYYRTAMELCIEAENEQEREFPTCHHCDGRRGLDCKGHCVECGEAPAEGEDYCTACMAVINGKGVA